MNKRIDPEFGRRYKALSDALGNAVTARQTLAQNEAALVTARQNVNTREAQVDGLRELLAQAELRVDEAEQDLSNYAGISNAVVVEVPEA